MYFCATGSNLDGSITPCAAKVGLEGERVALDPLPRMTSNPISYFVECIRNNTPIEDPLSMKLNVQVMEILDAARESVRTGKQQELE